MVESFWAIPDVTLMRTPISILREQAAALTENTNGLIVGWVDVQNEGHDITIRLELSVPGLNDYRYRILTYQQPIELYPGAMEFDNGLPRPVISEDHFIKLVKERLSSDKIKNVLTSLLAQVTDA